MRVVAPRWWHGTDDAIGRRDGAPFRLAYAGQAERHGLAGIDVADAGTPEDEAHGHSEDRAWGYHPQVVGRLRPVGNEIRVA